MIDIMVRLKRDGTGFHTGTIHKFLFLVWGGIVECTPAIRMWNSITVELKISPDGYRRSPGFSLPAGLPVDTGVVLVVVGLAGLRAGVVWGGFRWW